MESDHDQTPHTPTSDVDAAKNRFLDSMGLGENALRELAESGSTREVEDEVALSSQVDDMELPGASNKNVSIRVQAPAGVRVSAIRNASVCVEPATPEVPEEMEGAADPVDEVEEAPVESTPEVLPLEDSSVPEEPAVSAADDLFHLACPKCDGELVLRREHLGVDGACVWCEAPIVAAESSADGEVKVFPVFQPGLPVTKEEVAEVVETPEAEVEEEVVAEEPAPVPTPEPVREEPVVERAPLPEVSESTFEEASMGWGTPASDTPASEVSKPAEEVAPAMTEGFASPSFESAPEMPAADVPVEPAPSAPEEMPAATGFDAGSFAQSDWSNAPVEAAPSPEAEVAPAKSEEEEGSSGWSGDMVAPVKVAPAVETDQADAPAGFDAPTKPATLTEDAPATGFEQAAIPAPVQDPPAMAPDEPAASEAFSGFGAPTPAPEKTQEPAAAATPGEPSISNSAAEEDNGFSAAGWGQPGPAEAVEEASNPADATSATTGFSGEAEAPAFLGGSMALAPELSQPVQGAALTENAIVPSGFLDAAPVTEEDAAPDAGFESAKPAMVTETPAPTEGAPVEATPADDGFGNMMGIGSMPSPDEDAQPAAFGDLEPSPSPEVENTEPANSSFEIPSEEPSNSPFGNLPPAEDTGDAAFGSPPAPQGFGESVSIESAGLPAPEPEDIAPSGFAGEEESNAVESAPPKPPQNDAFMSGISQEGDAGASMFSSGATAGSSLFGNPAGESTVGSPESGLAEPAVEVEVETEVVESESQPAPPVEEAKQEAPSSNATPNVTSQPLGTKPKKTVRKGFIVMIVIILGFVCGAALASYVLPVERYVAQARAYMDKKFNPAGVVEMAPAVPAAPIGSPASAPGTPMMPPAPLDVAPQPLPANPLSPAPAEGAPMPQTTAPIQP